MSMKVFLSLLIFICNSTLVFCYEKSPYVGNFAWEKLQPYLLPENHPAKSALDLIFVKNRPTASHDAMKKAGFKFKMPRGSQRATVAKHSKLKNYLIKTYLDTQNTEYKEWKAWIGRIEGAKLIQASIDKHKYTHLMKTPRKWIYPLPPTPLVEGSPFRKNFILVVENMRILHYEENKLKYYHAVDAETLDALYVILTENRLIDSTYLDNIPFSKDGRIAFIDTEHYNNHERPLKLHRMTKYFSPEMQDYWRQLIHAK